jgi:hypothetical protein
MCAPPSICLRLAFNVLPSVEWTSKNLGVKGIHAVLTALVVRAAADPKYRCDTALVDDATDTITRQPALALND